ncbi:PREDICTED: vesicle-trafficking protein SEC22c [Thamnophis sirtalis]|uniref:Vesicle-trafficking protein SEC22c n=1 Tax=Thamnophis sirtalis TaxID=35019 RepID=A0A6I9XSP9_9SAUR|nr:PREDICTED: vesicle-trafficking protein SEC22c [Thamnophis sirtalis]
MSMILFTCVVRIKDGLPLSASSDFHLDPQFLECRKRLNILSSVLTQYPERGTAKECDLNSVIQKTQNQFNHTNCAQPKFDVAKMQEELRLRPPALVSWEDMELVNGMVNGRAEVHLEAVLLRRMSMILFTCVVRIKDGLPLSASSDFHLDPQFLECRKRLNILSSVLTQYPERGTAKECDLSIQMPEDGQEIRNVVAFLLPFLSCFGLCYLYLFYTSARKTKVSILFVTVFLCNLYLYGLRNHWQILFHVAVAAFSSHQILTRRVAEKILDLGV